MLFQPKRRSQSWLRKPPRRCLFQLSQFVVLEVDSSRQNRRLQLSRSALMESPNPNSQNPNEIESYVMVHNIAKRHNVGTLARSATAFGVSELILVGRRDFNAFGNHGSTTHLRFRHFHSLQEARFFLKGRDCDICGVEITDDAVAVSQHPFKKSTAFLLGNEGMGLSAKECEICDFFVYIPQYGCGTASLNVTVAASIVLHHFGVWAGFSERTRDGNKFVVAEKPVKQARRNYCAETAESITEKRKSRKENASNGFFDENGSANSSSNLLDALFDGLET